MSLAAPPPPQPLTAEALLAMPDDGVDRYLIRGELRERPMTRRNRKHARVEARIATLLNTWLDTQAEPRGEILSGEAGFRLTRDPDTFVGIDVAYASAELVDATPDEQAFYHGPPVLAVEVISLSDKHEEIVERVQAYLEVGTMVWVIDPHFRTLAVHRPGEASETLNVHDELSGQPELPGLRVKVAEIFGPSRSSRRRDKGPGKKR
jgi:Uma2 family endonuclease